MPTNIALALWLTAAPSLDAFAGTWELDLRASTDPLPMLTRLSAPWLVKKSASTTPVANVITTAPGTLTVEVKNPLGSRSSTLTLDGKTALTTDMFGKTTRYTSEFVGDAIVSRGSVEVDGAPVPLTLRRTVEADAMRLVITLQPKGEPDLTMTRVFRRR